MLLLMDAIFILYGGLKFGGALDDIGQSVLRRLDATGTSTTDIARCFAEVGVEAG